MVFIGALGARDVMLAQGVAANNLANASTTGFRADLARFASQGVDGPGFDTRAFSNVEPTTVDLATGALEQTGRPLDVAIDGDGFLAVQAPDGSEAYTRAGDLRRGPGGMLVTGGGHPVLGEGGPLVLPPIADAAVAADGTVSVRTPGENGDVVARLDRLKLVASEGLEWTKGNDGLLRTTDGNPAPLDANVKLVPGALEASNVSPVGELVRLIELGRQYELQVRVMRTAQDVDRASDSMLRLS